RTKKSGRTLLITHMSGIQPTSPQSQAQRFQALRRHFDSGATRSYAARRDALGSLGKALKNNEAAILEAMRLDMGKPTFEAYMSELGLVYAEIAHTLKHLKEWMRPQQVRTPLAIQVSSSVVHREPLGIVLIISPWNYPLQLLMAPLIGAIAAGNCALVKPSNEAPRTAAIIERIIAGAFSPEHVAVVQGPGGVVGPQLIERFRFDHIFFTGSPAVGRSIMAMAAPHLTPVTLELGGKSPAIVDREVDLNAAARRIAWAKYFNAGQTCISPDHALVHADVMEPFLIAFTKQVRAFFGEDPKQSPHFARLINAKRFNTVKGYLQHGHIRLGGEHDLDERYVAPTVLMDVPLDSPPMREEIFGPILPVVGWRDKDEVLDLVERNPFPLSAYIFSSNPATARHFIERIPFGGGCVNHCMLQFGNPGLPFGGIGTSGMGRYHGRSSFDVFSHQKGIVTSSTLLDPGVQYPPYNAFKDRVLRWILR
ncbi:MAG TPA: aldehyde dehydrogenase family protein, partial [Flavobacteriales bacterium]|nr:aldehyde dehydrogenase family protein [Flavobacteriales bacterium]